MVWGEVQRRFTYLQGYDVEMCMEHVLYIAGKAIHNIRSMLNKDLVKTRNKPFEDYNFIMCDVWEDFVQQKQSDKAKAKSRSSLSS